jgi:adenine-specific DNA-methyltransferase
MLIQGDNLDALKALLPYFAGQVKCIYIDPPYNTRSAFEHYDDNLEHSQWLAMIYPRLELLRELLSEDGSIWVSIDDNEGHYLKVVMDEVFGRKNFVANVVWQKKYTQANDAEFFSDNHDFILVAAKNRSSFELNGLPREEKQNKAFKNPDNDARGPWKATPLHAKSGTNKDFEFTFKNGITWKPVPGTFPRYSVESFRRMDENGEIWFGKNGKSVPSRKTFLTEVKQEIVPKSIWLFDEVGHNHEARTEVKELCPSDPFGTPKPERLLQRILHIATNPSDLVLDSFLGSGTTAAVAHKMGRRYIGIEMGEHAVTHCAPRMRKVIDGEQGGISAAVGWQGGGGFRFYRLGDAVFDDDGRINKTIRFAILAAHVWFSETKTPWNCKANPPQPPFYKGGSLESPPLAKGDSGGFEVVLSPLLGIHNNTAYYLLFNGILGDKRPDGGNVLTSKVLTLLPLHDGPKLIYGETSRLSAERLKMEGITFKQTPYDIKAR